MVIKTSGPLIPQYSDFNRRLIDIFQSGILTNNGEVVTQLEQELCEKYFDGKFVSSHCNGTMALVALLTCSDIKGKVLVPSFTFPATINAIIFAGLTPQIVDVGADTLNLSVNSLRNINFSEVGAVVNVQSYGQDPELDELVQFTKNNNCKIFFDSAQSFGSKNRSKSIIGHGDGSIVSLHATKVISSVEGGLCVVNDLNLHRKIKNFQNFGFNGSSKIALSPGLNTKLSEIHAAFFLASLPHLDRAINNRKEITNNYIKHLSNPSNFEFAVSISDGWNYAYAPFKARNVYIRDKIHTELLKEGIETRKYFSPPLHKMPAFKKYRTQNTTLTNSENLSDKILCLPLHTNISKKDVDLIINATRKVLDRTFD